MASQGCSSLVFGVDASSCASKAWDSGLLLAQDERALGFPDQRNPSHTGTLPALALLPRGSHSPGLQDPGAAMSERTRHQQFLILLLMLSLRQDTR